MPFTFSHVAAVVPLFPLKKFLNTPALVVGSMAPDLIFFLPMNLNRSLTHSPQWGIFISVFVGILFLTLYWKLLLPAFRCLAPETWQKQFFKRKLLPNPLKFWSLIISLFIGVLTHLIWDSFTHYNTWLPNYFPIWNEVVFSWKDWSITFYNILQHFSTLIGGMVLGVHLWKRCKKKSLRFRDWLGVKQIKIALVYCFLNSIFLMGILKWQMPYLWNLPSRAIVHIVGFFELKVGFVVLLFFALYLQRRQKTYLRPPLKIPSRKNFV